MIPRDELPEVIPPRTVVRLVRFDEQTPAWQDKTGTLYRVGYYSEQDGLDVIWLVDDDGDYGETVDKECLLDYFQLIELSDETDLYGVSRPPIGPRWPQD